jgi:hypothetical protein
MKKLYWAAGILVVLFILAAATASMNPGTKTETQSLLDKQSGFTPAECNELCSMTYEVQLSVDACQTTCSMVGKEGPTMDRTALNIIKIFKERH